MKNRFLLFSNGVKTSLSKEEKLKENILKGGYQRIEIENKATFRGYFGKNSYFLFKACTDDLEYKIIHVLFFGESYTGENIYNAIINALYNEIENNGFEKNFHNIYPDLYKNDDKLSIINEMLGFVKMILKNPQIIFLIDMQSYAIEYENFERLSKLKEKIAIVSTATVETQIEYFPNRKIFFESFSNLQPE